MASVTRSNLQKSKTNALKFGGMRTTDTKPGRSVNPLETERPIGLFSSLKIELSVLITISTAIAFIMAWFLLKVGKNPDATGIGWNDHTASIYKLPENQIGRAHV